MNIPEPAAALNHSTTPTGVNDARQIVGTYLTGTFESGFFKHGFIRSVIGYTVVLDYPAPRPAPATAGEYAGTYVTGINNAGTIVGYFNSPMATIKQTGFIYRKGAFTSYRCKMRGKAVATRLLGISNGGDVLVQCNGGYFVGNSYGRRLVAIDNSSLPNSVMTGLNRFGDVVGHYNPADQPSTYFSFIIPGVIHSAHH